MTSLIRSAPGVGILHLQRRLTEVGRIRAGEKVPTSGGRSRPSKRTTWRITSRDQQRLEAAAEIYGGEVRPWEGRPGEFELNTTSDTLDVAVVAGQAISQSMELWGQAHGKNHQGPNPVICLRRCDGETETFTNGSCLCMNEEDPPCRPTTRLSVMLTKVPGVGVWRVESHGKNAAEELIGVVELLEILTASHRRPVQARLRLDQRKQTVTIRGPRGAIKTEERHFVVPVLDIDHTLEDVLAITSGAADARSGAIEAPAQGADFTPVPELPAGPAESIEDQLKAGLDQEKTRRSEPIKRTGRAPRPAAAVGAPPEPTDDDAPPPPDDSAPGPTRTRPQIVSMLCRDAGLDDDGRHAFLEAFSRVIDQDGPYTSATQVPEGHMQYLRRALDRLKAGKMRLAVAEDGKTPILWSTEKDEQVTSTGTPVPPAGADEPWDAVRWREALKNVPGIGEGKLLRYAREVAGELQVPLPSSIGEITGGPLAVRCITWLKQEQQR